MNSPTVDRQGPALPSGVIPLTPGEPETVGGYSLIGRLGAGGMGCVYLGRDSNGGVVAVKVAHAGLAADAEVRARFRDEAACLRRVPAHCTVRLLADGTDQTPPHIVTDYIAGRSLKEVVEEDGPLSPERLHALAAGVARTLAVIHRAGLVHRDLKPANVMLTPTGPRIIDFGIAREILSSGGLTGSGMIVGSIGWISPERLSRGPATPASDVFGWGCLVAYAGTGRQPYGSGDAQEIARRVILESPDLDGLDASVRPLVAEALVKAPDARPSAERLLTRLSPAGPLAEPGPSRHEAATDTAEGTVPLPYARPRRRALGVVMAAAAVVAVAATGTAWVATGAGRDVPPPVHGSSVQPKTPDSAAIARDSGVSPPTSPAAEHARPDVHHGPPTGGRGHDRKPGHGKKGHGR